MITGSRIKSMQLLSLQRPQKAAAAHTAANRGHANHYHPKPDTRQAQEDRELQGNGTRWHLPNHVEEQGSKRSQLSHKAVQQQLFSGGKKGDSSSHTEGHQWLPP